jgi:hypothetical protein
MYLLQPHSYGRTAGKLFILFLMLTLGARQGFAQYGGGNGTSGSPYLISTAAHLVSLSQDPNDWALHFRQTANINLNGVSLNDIDFSGVYDGDNFTISNYTITGTSNDKGLFSELVGSATVQDLTLNNFNISGDVRVGALAGKANSGTTIDNVDATGVSIDGNFDSGGLIGECGGCTIQNSTVDATSMIDCGNTGGGIVGKSVSSATYTNLSSSAQMTGSSLGGIVGNIFNNPTFTNCSSAATISNSTDRLGGIAGKCSDTPSFSGCSFSGSISGTYHCGGIIGRVEGGTATITNCNNSGSITQTDDEGGGIIGTVGPDDPMNPPGIANVSTSYNTGSINANWKSAGIIGRVNSNSTVTITECYNSGTITSNSNQAGGIVGTSTGVSNIIESYNTGSITSSANSGGIIGRVETPASGHSSLTNCYNTGAIDGGWSAGIIGEETDGGATTVVNCYNAGTVDNDSSVGDFVSKGGSATVTATNCFYDEEVNFFFTSQTISEITGKTTAEMKDYTTFTTAGWDFVSETTNGPDNFWDADQLGTVNNGYMILRWQAGADDDLIYTYSGGAGTQGDPYQIATAADLIQLSSLSGDWDKHFIQTANIDFDEDETAVDWDNDGSPDGASPAGFSPIGNFATEFTGSYDGDGKTISNLFINRSGSFYLGLFGQVSLSGGGISDLGLLNADITGFAFVGAIVGSIASSSTGSVSGCYSTGSVVGSNNQIGGLVGLVGNSPTSRIENCYSRCSVNGGSKVGGLVGVIEAVNTTTAISNCYSTGAVTGTGDDVGGLVGANINGGITTDSFWDTDTSGQSTDAGGEGKSTAEMKDIFTFSGAEWGGPWYIDFAQSENSGYPNLDSIGVPVVAGSRSIEIVSTGGGSEDTDWGMTNGIMYSLQDNPTSVNVSDVVSKLGLSPLEIVGSSLDVNGTVTSGSSNILYLNLETGGTIQPGAALDLGGGLYLVGDTRLTLTSSSTSYSSLIVDGPLTENCGGDCISYERYTNQVGTGSSGGNDLVGTPFTGQPFGPFAAANTNLAYSGSLRAFGPWDNTGTGFINYDVTANAGTTLTPGTGYRAATTDGSPVIFTGTVQTGNVTVNITDAASQWNAVANPYPAYLSMADFLNYDHGGGVTNQSLMVESAAGIYGYDGNSTDGWTVITLANASTSLMAPGQGFFVAADAADVDTYDLTFTPTMMRTGDSDDFINGFAPVQTPVYFKLQAFTDSRSYGTSIYFNEASATGLDVGYDAVLWGDAIPDFAVYTHLVSEDEGEPFALQSLGLSDLDDPELAIPLGLEAAAGIPLTLAITEEELPAGIEVYLLDSLNGERTLLSGLPYTFTPNAALSGAGRYYLVFNAGQVVSTSSETDGSDLSALVIYAPQYREELVITGELPGAAQLSLYDVQGRKLLGRALSAGTTQQTVATGHLPGGIYLVRIESPQGVRAEQLFIP